MFLVDLGNKKVTVEFRHKQFPIPVFKEKISDSFMNGVTTCVVHEVKERTVGPNDVGVIKDATLLMTAPAICKFPDAFQKSVGRRVALTRTLKRAKFTREERIKIWFAYWLSLQPPLPRPMPTVSEILNEKEQVA